MNVFRCLFFALSLLLSAKVFADGPLAIEPGQRTLLGADARQQLIVTETISAREIDRTRDAQFVSSNPAIATVDASGIVRSVGDGTTTIVASWNGNTAKASVTVSHAGEALPVNFANDIVPVLSKAGCNAGSCHGKQSGPNGFKLSILGFDPAFDYSALVSEARGRRAFPAAS